MFDEFAAKAAHERPPYVQTSAHPPPHKGNFTCSNLLESMNSSVKRFKKWISSRRPPDNDLSRGQETWNVLEQLL